MVPALPADGTGYKATLGLLAAEFAALDIPVRVLQYDSWWYYKSNDQGKPLPGPNSTILTVWSRICAGMYMCGALPCPVCA